MKIVSFKQDKGQEAKVKEQSVDTELVVPKANSRNSGRPYNAVNRETTVHYLYKLFYENELANPPRTNDDLKADLLLTYKHRQAIKRRFKSYQYTINMFRNQYNLGTLWQSQPATFLMSFQYDECGYVVIGGNRIHEYMYFEDCYQRCDNYKMADPRFIPYELIVEIRNRQQQGDPDWLQWMVPTDADIKTLKTNLKVKEVYNSVNFRDGWTREATPKDFISKEQPHPQFVARNQR